MVGIITSFTTVSYLASKKILPEIFCCIDEIEILKKIIFSPLQSNLTLLAKG